MPDEPASRALEARAYRARGSLLGGETVLLRAIRPDDRERLREAFDRLSPWSVYHRFFEFKRELTERDLDYYTELDFQRHVGLVATLDEAGRERIIGVARYLLAGPERAEAAFAVVDEHQGRGVGTLLLWHLAHLGRAAGVREFDAEVLADNRRMLEVFENSALRVHRRVEQGVVSLTLGLEGLDERGLCR